VDYLPYMQRIQAAIGSIQAADGIKEDSWFDVVIREVDALSGYCADEYQRETGFIWNKGTFVQNLREAPPVRLLALALAVTSWVGWIMHSKHGETGSLSSTDCLRLLQEAFESGVQLSKSGVVP
jgi:hypothetical protein